MKKLPVILSAIAGIALQSAAFAGYHATSLVSVYKSSSGGSAYGSMQSARYYSSDSNEYIGCLAAADLVSSIYITCSARNAPDPGGDERSAGSEAQRQLRRLEPGAI